MCAAWSVAKRRGCCNGVARHVMDIGVCVKVMHKGGAVCHVVDIGVLCVRARSKRAGVYVTNKTYGSGEVVHPVSVEEVGPLQLLPLQEGPEEGGQAAGKGNGEGVNSIAR